MSETAPVFRDLPPVNPATILTPTFRDNDNVYFADNCASLSAAVSAGELRMDALSREPYPGMPLRDGEVPGIRALGYWDASQHQSWGLDFHRNEGLEITYLARGQLDFSVDDSDWSLHSGHLTITRPWQRHRVGNPNVGPSRLHWCILDVDVRRPNQKWQWPSWLALAGSDLSRLTQLLQHNEHPVWPGNRDIDATFEELALVVSQPQLRTRDSRLRQITSRLLLDVLELLEEQNVVLDQGLSSPRRSVQLFLAELAHVLDRRWSLGEMADSCDLGRTRFAQYCQEITNMAPVEYLTYLRMKRAAELIRTEPFRPITDIAFQCGYESSQYFATAFSKHYGQSPRAFRREALTV